MYVCVQLVCMVPVKASSPFELELEMAETPCDHWGLSSGPPEEQPALAPNSRAVFPVPGKKPDSKGLW